MLALDARTVRIDRVDQAVSVERADDAVPAPGAAPATTGVAVGGRLMSLTRSLKHPAKVATPTRGTVLPRGWP